MNIVILGSLGLIGHGINSVLSKESNFHIFRTYSKVIHKTVNKQIKRDFLFFDFLKHESILKVFSLKPDVIINCVGITKHLSNNFSGSDK